MSTSPQDIVDAIDAAILSMMSGGGAQTLSVIGRSITYTSLDALRKARTFYADIARAATNSSRSQFTRARVIP